ncbi:MAG TPA: hypothetical protein VFO37_05355, partial [Chitinophagaceae bacterium]|nr:hypothetical protein [Chitinophagaceae bacterium]
MDEATRLAAGYEAVEQSRKEANMLEEIETLKAQVNVLRLGEKPEPVNWIAPLNVPYQQNPPQQNQWQNPSQQNKQNGEITCYRCNKKGHMQRDCRAVQCYSCGKMGHLSKDCRSRPQSQQLPQQNWQPPQQQWQIPQQPSQQQWQMSQQQQQQSQWQAPQQRPPQNQQNRNQPKDWTNIECSNCRQKGHKWRNCPTLPTPGQNNNQNNPFRQVNALSRPPIQPYDIIPDMWNQAANVTFGELMVNEEYRQDVQQALQSMESPNQVFQIDPIKTSPMTIWVRLNNQRKEVVVDSGAALSLISLNLVKELGLVVTQEKDE